MLLIPHAVKRRILLLKKIVKSYFFIFLKQKSLSNQFKIRLHFKLMQIINYFLTFKTISFFYNVIYI